MFADEPDATVPDLAAGSPVSLLDTAVQAFQAGKPVLIHDFDDRESEVDLVYPALAVTPDDVRRLRNDAGGLICVALSHDVTEEFDLPFLAEEISHGTNTADHRGYDERSSFSLTVNHRNTYTGITDIDRSLTITALGRVSTECDQDTFETEFRSPGHVHLLKAAPNLLADRTGHTELALALAGAAGRAPAVVVCEMLDGQSGRSLSKRDAQRYARRHNLPYINGQTILRDIDEY